MSFLEFCSMPVTTDPKGSANVWLFLQDLYKELETRGYIQYTSNPCRLSLKRYFLNIMQDKKTQQDFKTGKVQMLSSVLNLWKLHFQSKVNRRVCFQSKVNRRAETFSPDSDKCMLPHWKVLVKENVVLNSLDN